MSNAFEILQDEIVSCRKCERLRVYCADVAREKRRAYRDWDYWGKPVPSFGGPKAQLLILGLAPAAHGANRTGRMFTGDRSGDYLFRALHASGFASQPQSLARGDGLTLKNAYIAASAHCAPPGNKPLPDELRACRGYLERELDMLKHLKAVVVLGKLAFDIYLSVLHDQGVIKSRAAFHFGHNVEHPLSPLLISSYHPSQQNTSTGRLTDQMLLDVFVRARQALNR